MLVCEGDTLLTAGEGNAETAGDSRPGPTSKNEVIVELMEENVRSKKAIGEL